MSTDKNKKFDDSELSNPTADDLYWGIIGIDNEIDTFIENKRKEQKLFRKKLEEIQENCGREKDGHDFRLYKEAVIEIDRDKYKCQKCGKTTT
jgi:hypothetical protein